jgi:hypothetical protein
MGRSSGRRRWFLPPALKRGQRPVEVSRSRCGLAPLQTLRRGCDIYMVPVPDLVPGSVPELVPIVRPVVGRANRSAGVSSRCRRTGTTLAASLTRPASAVMRSGTPLGHQQAKSRPAAVAWSTWRLEASRCSGLLALRVEATLRRGCPDRTLVPCSALLVTPRARDGPCRACWPRTTPHPLLRWSISGYHPPEPREDLTQVDPFWDSFDHVRQVELGNGGRSTDDSFAMWHLWSFPGRRELVGMRMAAMPHPSAMGFGSRSGRSLRDPVRLTFEEDGRQVAWEAGPGHRLAMTGMKVLAVEFECPHRDVWGELRTAPDGIDQLCGGTGPAI